MKKESSMNIDWSKDMIDKGFEQEIGKCIFVDADLKTVSMRLNICRTGEDELTMTGAWQFGEDGDVKTVHSTYKRNQDME